MPATLLARVHLTHCRCWRNLRQKAGMSVFILRLCFSVTPQRQHLLLSVPDAIRQLIL